LETEEIQEVLVALVMLQAIQLPTKQVVMEVATVVRKERAVVAAAVVVPILFPPQNMELMQTHQELLVVKVV
jgi:hypothetical protein